MSSYPGEDGDALRAQVDGLATNQLLDPDGCEVVAGPDPPEVVPVVPPATSTLTVTVNSPTIIQV